MTTLMAVDTPYLYFRSFHGIPTSMTSPSGEPVNAIRGVLDGLATLLRHHRPDALVCAWDANWRPQWRVDLVPSYKTHRLAAERRDEDVEEVPDLLTPQIPVIREILEALGLPAVGVAEHEADDVLGSYARSHDGRSLVVTGDRDLFQLVDDDCRVVYIGRGVAKAQVVDDAWLRETYGLPGSRYTDFAVLRGDPSDGLPGVSGIGEKTAARMVAEFDDLDSLIAAAEQGVGGLGPANRSRLVDAADYIRRARRVVDVVTDLPVPPPSTLPAPVDLERVAALAERWGLGGSMARVLEQVA